MSRPPTPPARPNKKNTSKPATASVQEDLTQATLRSALVQLPRIIDPGQCKNKALELKQILAI